MAQALKNIFEEKKKMVSRSRMFLQHETNEVTQGQPALVTFVTAGYPTKEATVPLLLAMQKGGADVIELGVPFSDPVADGPSIQETNAVCGHNRPPFRVVLTTNRYR